jgi:hypothetical protein
MEQRFSRMLRLGYQARNPMASSFWKDIHQRVESLDHSRNPVRSTATGFTIVGISGVGKTTSVETILSLYPQIILHSNYRDANFGFEQIVWLKLDCPFDGSIKGLCLNFFQAIDDLLETNYYKEYVGKGARATVDALLPNMARVASLHAIGVLVIDEIQHLSQAKSGGSSKMLNFFVQLINTIGLPVVLVGTYKALSVLTGEFRQTRRGSGQGDLVWDRMSQDDTWSWFVESLWEYQYVRKTAELTEQLSKALYEESQGITDFAVKLFMLAQIEAITSGQESLSEEMIRLAARKKLKMARPILDALRRGDTQKLMNVEDVHKPIDFDAAITQAQTALSASGISPAAPRKSASSTTNQKTEDHKQAVASSASPASATTKSQAPKQTRKGKGQALQGSLVQIAVAGEKQQLSAYEALKQAGVIRSASEYLQQEMG